MLNHFTPGGKLISTSTNTSETKFTWDGAGRPRTSVSKPGTGVNAITETRYDNAGRLLRSSFGEGIAKTMTRSYSAVELGYGR